MAISSLPSKFVSLGKKANWSTKTILSALLMFAFWVNAEAQTTVFSEDFTAADGTTSATWWSTDLSGCSVTSTSYMKVMSNKLEARYLNCNATFTTYPIDISQYGNVGISAAVTESGSLESTDRIQLMYSVDGEAFQYFATNGNKYDDFTSMTASQTGLSGKSLIIKIIAYNNASDEYYRIDDLTVTGTQKDNFTLSSTKVNASCSVSGSIDLSVTPGISGSGSTSPYTGGCTVTMTGSNSYTLTSGQVGCVSGSFSGNVTINGGTFINNGSASISSFNFWSGTFINNGTLSVSNFANYSGRQVYNYGTILNSGTLTIGDLFYNYGPISTSGLAINTGGGLLNQSDIVVNGSFTNNSYVINSGTITVSSGITNNSGSSFVNNGVLTGSSITQNAYFDNRGTLSVNSYTTINSSGGLVMNSGSALSTGSMTVNGYIVNPGGGACANIAVSGNTTMNSSGSMSGNVQLCDANGVENNWTSSYSGGAALNCNCSGGGYTYLWSNGATTQDLTGLSAGTYSVTVTGPNGTTATTSVTITGSGVSGDPTVFGSNVWRVYAWNAGNAGGTGGAWTNNYSGYYVINSLNFDTRPSQTYSTAQSWAVLASPSSASGYVGCTVGNDNHSYAFKRQGFPCGYYQINLPANDDRVEIHIDGSMVYSNNTYGTNKNNVWTGFLGASTTLELRISEGGGDSYGSIELVKQADITVASTTAGSRCGTGTVTLGATASSGNVIDWYAASSGGSVLSGGSGTNSFTTPSISSTTTYYAQARNVATGCVSATRTAVTATVTAGSVSASISGTNSICSGSTTFTATGGGTYLWSTGATTAAISVSTAGTYTVTVTNGGCSATASRTLTVSNVSASISGTNSICSGNSSTFTATGGGTYLWSTGATSAAISVNTAGTYTVTVTNGSCTASASRTLTVNNVQITSSGAQMACNDAARTLTSNVGGGTWSGTGVSGNSFNPATSGAGTFTVTYTASGCSATQQITVGAPGDPAVFGSEVWNVYAWDAGDASGNNGAWTNNYRGYYVINSLNFDTRTGQTYSTAQSWGDGASPSYASGYQGCFVGTDNHSYAFKRQGFPCGNYTINLPNHDDRVQLYVNGTLAYDMSGCCATRTNIWTGFLGASSTLELRISEGGGGSHGSIELVKNADILVTSTTPASRCGTGTVTLGATASSGAVIDWYASASGGTVLSGGSGTNSFTTPSIGSTTTYYAEARHPGTGCVSASRTAVAATINGSTPASISGTNSICTGGSSTFTATGGGTYLWSTGATSAAISVSTAGTYTVTATNNGCTSTASRTLTVNSNPTASISGTNSICTGATSTFTATGGGTYLWSTGATSAAITISTAGTYTVTVTNASGCTATASRTLTVTALSASISGTNTVCAGSSSTFTATGGGTYLWSTGATSAAISVGTAGAYTVTVTNGGCTATASYALTVNALPTATMAVTPVTCGFCTNGSATVTVSGAAPYTYAWSGGGSTNTISNKAPGTYTVTVTDANGCSMTKNAIINLPLQVNIAGASACSAGSGSATASGAGGTAPYTFVWSTGATTATISNLSSGTYYVTGTDATGVTATQSVVISNTNYSGTLTPSSAAICVGQSVQLTATGANVYNWTPSTGLSNASIANPIASPTATTTYNLNVGVTSGELVTNGNFESGNTGFTSAYGAVYAPGNSNKLQPEGLYAVDTNARNYHNNFAGLGHGAPGSKFMIINGATLAGQTIWSQTVNVTPNTDYNFSTWITSVNAASPAQLRFEINGVMLGPVIAAPSTVGAWIQFNTNWSSGSATSAVISIVNENAAASGNDYGLDDISFTTVCNVNHGSVTVTVNPLPTTDAGADKSICSGSSASLTATGAGTGGTYAWSTGGSTAAISVSPTATTTYTVTATTNKGCSTTDEAIVTVNANPSVSIAGTNVACRGAATGTATVTVTGGNAPYTYNWGGGITTQNRTGLAAGTYAVTVTTANGCTGTANITITQPATALSATATPVHVSCNGGTNGSITLSATGGNTPYTYNWGGGITTQNRTALAAGTYTVTITDANGCAITSATTITQPAAVSGSIVATNVGCYGGTTGAATLTASGGTAPYTYNWGGGITTQNRSNLAVGSYAVTITDSRGCTGTASVTLTQPSAALSASATATAINCYGQSTGTATLSVTGGTTPYTYNWGGGVTTQNRTGIAAGNYTVTVTDANGCTASAAASVTQPAAALSLSSSVTNVSTNGGSNGAINLTATGGTTPYSYNWGGGITTQNRTALVPGSYTVTVTDANGCTATHSATVTQPAGPCICIASGNWTNPATWSGGCSGGGGKYAGYLDSIVLQGFKVIVDSAHTVKYLILKESTSDTTRLLFTGTNSLNVLEQFNMNTSGTGKNVELDIDGSADFVVNGDFVINHNQGNQVLINLNRNSGNNAKLWVKGNLDLNMGTSAVASMLINANAANDTIKVDGDILFQNNRNSSSVDMFVTMKSSSKLLVSGNVRFYGIRSQNMELQLNSTSRMELGGSIIRDASPKKFGRIAMASGARLVFNGSDQQIWERNTGNTDVSTITNVTINNTSPTSPQVLLDGDVTITGTLTMQDGNIGTGENMLILTSTSSSALSGHSANSYIVGTLRRYIASNLESYDFPLGYGAPNEYYWARIINNLMVGPSYLTASFGEVPVDQKNQNIRVPDGYEVFTELNQVGIWTIDPNTQPILGSYSIEVGTENFPGLVDDMFRIIKRPSRTGKENWNNGNVLKSLLNQVDRLVGTGKTKLPNLTSFSDFGIGQSGGGSLPIDLVSFGAQPDGTRVRLDWTVSMEINNDYFTIERSLDGLEFEPVAVVKGAGSHSTQKDYQTYDEQPYMGLSYYRLRQTDFDGATKAYDMVSVTMASNNATGTKFDIYPNPNKGSFTLRMDTPFDQVTVTILNNMGQMVYINELLGATGKTQTQLDLGDILATGVYFVKVDSGRDTYIKQMVIE